MSIQAINWNKVQNDLDLQVWDRLTANFWLDTKIPISNDLPSWRSMTEQEREVIRKVFTTLTLLDTIQGVDGMPSISDGFEDGHTKAVLANIQFMEHVHAKSYSTIFSTLCSSQEIEQLFNWAANDPLTQKLATTLHEIYSEANSLASRIVASVLSESFLFYTGFYAPLRMASEGKITNTADIIRLILRDEGVHGFYLGQKFQQLEDSAGLADDVYALLSKLYSIEMERTEALYDKVGWTEEVKAYLRYNANKALANLGLDPMFEPDSTKIPAYILAALDPGTGETHDFFSGSGASYVIGKAEETEDDDWEW